MFQNANPLEVGWTVPSLVGLTLAVVLLYLSVKDEAARRRAGVDGVVRLDVQKSIATAVALVVALGCLSLVGVNAMATPPNPLVTRDPTTAATAVANALLLIVANVSLIALAGYRLLQRGAVQREIRDASRRDRRKGDRPPLEPAPPVPPEIERRPLDGALD